MFFRDHMLFKIAKSKFIVEMMQDEVSCRRTLGEAVTQLLTRAGNQIPSNVRLLSRDQFQISSIIVINSCA